MKVKIWLLRKIRRFKETGIIVNRKVTISLIFFCCAVLLLGCGNLLLIPKIDLNGNKKIIVDYKEKYIEKGYEASFLGNDISDDVQVSGIVNTKKLGTYEITYKVRAGLFTRKVTRTVEVRDREEPKLLIDDSDIYLCPGDEIVPDKVKAKDNYDGDISRKVENIIGKNKIVYRVEDTSGNESSVTKKVLFSDVEKPTININGSEYEYVFVGEKYNDPGVDIKDNCDKSIKENLVIDNKVNSKKAGEYEIVYTVKDKAGNEAKAVRKILVSERNKVGTIYLTFDDGPNPGTTDVILNILKEEGVEATFFVTNHGPDELIKREYDEGHTVALHTASHDYSIVYASDESYFNDLGSVHDRVKRITGYDSRIIRFPGGSSNTISRRYSDGIMSRLTQEVVNRGYKYYDWNISSGDAAGGNPAPETIYNNVVSNLSHDKVNMVLMHDIKTYTRDALRNIIKYGKENGYTFEKITMGTEMITQRVNN